MTATQLSELPATATLREVSDTTKIPIHTLRRWTKRGVLEPIQPSGPGGLIRVRVRDVELLLRGEQ